MCSAMVLRAFSWHAILRAALPRARVRLSDAMQGTFIGVLMSSTLPARLGEPSRALVVAPLTLLILVLIAPAVIHAGARSGAGRFTRLADALTRARGALTRVRAGLI